MEEQYLFEAANDGYDFEPYDFNDFTEDPTVAMQWDRMRLRYDADRYARSEEYLKQYAIGLLDRQGCPSIAKLARSLTFKFIPKSDKRSIAYLEPSTGIIRIAHDVDAKQVVTLVKHEVAHAFLEHQMRIEQHFADEHDCDIDMAKTYINTDPIHKAFNVAADMEISNQIYTAADKATAVHIRKGREFARGIVTEVGNPDWKEGDPKWTKPHPEWENYTMEQIYDELEEEAMSALKKAEMMRKMQKDIADRMKDGEENSEENSDGDNPGYSDPDSGEDGSEQSDDAGDIEGSSGGDSDSDEGSDGESDGTSDGDSGSDDGEDGESGDGASGDDGESGESGDDGDGSEGTSGDLVDGMPGGSEGDSGESGESGESGDSGDTGSSSGDNPGYSGEDSDGSSSDGSSDTEGPGGEESSGGSEGEPGSDEDEDTVEYPFDDDADWHKGDNLPELPPKQKGKRKPGEDGGEYKPYVDGQADPYERPDFEDEDEYEWDEATGEIVIDEKYLSDEDRRMIEKARKKLDDPTKTDKYYSELKRAKELDQALTDGKIDSDGVASTLVLSFRNFIAKQITREERKNTYAVVDKKDRARRQGIMKPGHHYVDVPSIPEVRIYFDRSGSWSNNKKLQIGYDLGNSIAGFQRQGKIKVSYRWFNEKGVFDHDVKPWGNEGAENIIKDLINFQNEKSRHNAIANCVIVTDSDTGNCDAITSSVELNGGVWLVFVQNKSLAEYGLQYIFSQELFDHVDAKNPANKMFKLLYV